MEQIRIIFYENVYIIKTIEENGREMWSWNELEQTQPVNWGKVQDPAASKTQSKNLDSSIRLTVISTAWQVPQKVEQNCRNDEKQKRKPVSPQVQKTRSSWRSQKNLESRIR